MQQLNGRVMNKKTLICLLSFDTITFTSTGRCAFSRIQNSETNMNEHFYNGKDSFHREKDNMELSKVVEKECCTDEEKNLNKSKGFGRKVNFEADSLKIFHSENVPDDGFAQSISNFNAFNALSLHFFTLLILFGLIISRRELLT